MTSLSQFVEDHDLSYIFKQTRTCSEQALECLKELKHARLGIACNALLALGGYSVLEFNDESQIQEGSGRWDSTEQNSVNIEDMFFEGDGAPAPSQLMSAIEDSMPDCTDPTLPVIPFAMPEYDSMDSNWLF
jgi:hypothetical protein